MPLGNRIYVIAEAGVNHNGSPDIARELVEAASAAGADAVKFQSFRAADLVTSTAVKAKYQENPSAGTETQREMLARLQMPLPMHDAVAKHCKDLRIDFLSTPFELQSLQLLTSRYGMRRIKVASGEVTNGPFLLEISRVAEHVIMSTGMCSLADVERALDVLAFGFVREGIPTKQDLELARQSEDSLVQLRRRVTLLHCTSEYPAPLRHVNLRSMLTLRHAFGVPVGYSDHTKGIHVAVAAAALGATVIEKHFTVDKSLPGPDQKASLDPSELRQMICAIRDVELALGTGVKGVTALEHATRDVSRKSLVALKSVSKGDIWSPESLGYKRPGTGRSPMEFWDFLGTRATQAYEEDDLV